VLGAGSASAQISRAPGYIEDVRRAAEYLYAQSRQRPLNEESVRRHVRDLRAASKAASDALTGFAEPLAAAAGYPYEEKLREPAKLAKGLAFELGPNDVLIQRCDEVIRLLDLAPDRRESSFEQSIENLGNSLNIFVQRKVTEVTALKTKSDELRRWLLENLQATQTMSQDAVKPGAYLDSTRQGLEDRMRDVGTQLHRLVDQVVECQKRELDAGRRYRDARVEHDTARMAPPSSSYTGNATAAYRKWLTAQAAHKESASQLFNAYNLLDIKLDECKRQMEEVARVWRDVEKFQETANPETIGKRLTDFSNWHQIFEREMNR
jgi:hypothetical protein